MSTRAIARREPQQLSDSDEFCHLLSIELNRYSRADWRLTSWVSQPLTTPFATSPAPTGRHNSNLHDVAPHERQQVTYVGCFHAPTCCKSGSASVVSCAAPVLLSGRTGDALSHNPVQINQN
jgi:hypothetical protein